MEKQNHSVKMNGANKGLKPLVIWNFSETVSNRLFAWNVANILTGVVLSRKDSKYWQGFGSQNVGWGLINIGIALGGAYFTGKRKESLPDPNAPHVIEKETRNLRNILWINAGLDIVYMIGGRWLARTRGANSERLRGVGIGIVLQGGLLFVFDVIHALLIEEQST